MSSLPGLESFSLINSAQSSHSRMVIINGDRSSESGVRFDLEFLTPWPGEYHIWPIVIDSSQWAIQSNTLSVSVRERFVASKVSGWSDTWRWWLLGVAALVIFGYIINACKKLILGKKTRPLMVYSRDEVQERIQSCQEVDGLFFLLQDLLAHVHGDRVRSKTHDELKSLQDSRALSDLLEAFKTNRYAKSQVALENVRETFLSYLDDYDGFESNDSNN